jgi:hypothetical protein
LACAVVVVLSEAFIGKPYPMEELHLLLEWRSKGSAVRLLPVFYDITWEDFHSKVQEYGASSSEAERQRSKDLSELGSIATSDVAASEQRCQEAAGARRKQQWVEDLGELEGITGIRPDQVCLIVHRTCIREGRRGAGLMALSSHHHCIIIESGLLPTTRRASALCRTASAVRGDCSTLGLRLCFGPAMCGNSAVW